ncbi:MAG: acyl-CoA dehydratase activase-related protein [Candidatus Binatia bacterium]|nr:acyl-CoA dehydratase activase-related protein [Candidatus Binatia bacterium]
MPIPMWRRWFGSKPSAPTLHKNRAAIRVGIPKVLNIWSTHQFWLGFLTALGIRPSNIVFSSDTSEEQYREFGKGWGTVDCCYPVKSISGHYGELLFGQKVKIDLLLSPMIYSLPSFLQGHVIDTLSCPRVMAAPENIKSGFLKERDTFAATGVHYVSPLVSLGEPQLVPGQLYKALRDVLGLDKQETARAVAQGYASLEAFNRKMRAHAREILTWCAREQHPCLLMLGRPYHMDPGIGHEIDVDLQAHGYPVLWIQYFPCDADVLEWLFGAELRAGQIRSPFDISDVWSSSYSSNTNEILWGAKVATRCPWITCVVHLSSYECGMDQPTYTPVQKIVEASGTLYFKFGDLDATKPAGGVKIRVQTIVHYLRKYSQTLIARKLAWLPGPCPLLTASEDSSPQRVEADSGIPARTAVAG